MSELSSILDRAANAIEPEDNELAALLRTVAKNYSASTDSAMADAAGLVLQMDPRRNPVWDEGKLAALNSAVRTVFMSAAPQSVKDQLRYYREQEDNDRMNGREHEPAGQPAHDHIVDVAKATLAELHPNTWAMSLESPGDQTPPSGLKPGMTIGEFLQSVLGWRYVTNQTPAGVSPKPAPPSVGMIKSEEELNAIVDRILGRKAKVTA